MPIYYVATLARYVLVEAANESAAREAGMNVLRELYAPERRLAPIEIRTIRLATEDEIELDRRIGHLLEQHPRARLAHDLAVGESTVAHDLRHLIGV